MDVLPQRMKRIETLKPGGPESLAVREGQVDIGPTRVLIQLAAAGLTRADILQRQGHCPPFFWRPGASRIESRRDDHCDRG